MEHNAITQVPKDKVWLDETGAPCQYSRTTAVERQKEKGSAKILKGALDINDRLTKFKRDVREICQNIHHDWMESKEVKTSSKGNFTWYNFDRSIKIEVSINERIEFDDLGIQSAKLKFDEFFSENLVDEDSVIKSMVLDAFNTTGGRLDTKKVMTLVRYKDKVKSPLFKSAVDDVLEAIRRPDSKMYFRVWVKIENNEYESINLNFSSI